MQDFNRHLAHCNVLKVDYYKRMVAARLMESQQQSILQKFTDTKRQKRRREKAFIRSVS